MKIKILEGYCRLSQRQTKIGIEPLEDKVQVFLQDNPTIEVVSIKQSSASSGDADDFGSVTTLSIFYKIKGDD